MDGELTAQPSSNGEGNGGEGESPDTPDTCREIIDKAFPSYLAMGMTYDEFYNKDHTLVIAYRKAFELKRNEQNQNLWLLGAYVYQAIARVSPLFNPFSKHPKPESYLDKPFPVYEHEEGKNAKSKAVADKGLAYMQAQMIKFNKKFGKE